RRGYSRCGGDDGRRAPLGNGGRESAQLGGDPAAPYVLIADQRPATAQRQQHDEDAAQHADAAAAVGGRANALARIELGRRKVVLELIVGHGWSGAQAPNGNRHDIPPDIYSVTRYRLPADAQGATNTWQNDGGAEKRPPLPSPTPKILPVRRFS